MAQDFILSLEEGLNDEKLLIGGFFSDNKDEILIISPAEGFKRTAFSSARSESEPSVLKINMDSMQQYLIPSNRIEAVAENLYDYSIADCATLKNRNELLAYYRNLQLYTQEGLSLKQVGTLQFNLV